MAHVVHRTTPRKDFTLNQNAPLFLNLARFSLNMTTVWTPGVWTWGLNKDLYKCRPMTWMT